MIDLNWAERRPLNNIALKTKRAYYDLVYRITRAALEPVVAAISDVIRESVAEGVKNGIAEALTPTDIFGDFFFGRRRRK